MKGTTALLVALFLSAVPAVAAPGFSPGEAEPSSDEPLIRAAVEGLYIKGLQTRDFELIRTVCVPEAVLMSVGEDDRLHVTTLDTWSKRFDPKNPPFETLDFTIAGVDVVGSAAQVKIQFVVNGNTQVTDFLNLLKLEGRWRIVHIIDF